VNPANVRIGGALLIPPGDLSRLDKAIMARVIREIDRGTRTIDNVLVTVTELIWDDAGRSFDAHLASDGTLLTELESFDNTPDDAALLDLLDEHRGLWRCPGCHATVAAGDHDLVADHLRDCTPAEAGAR
jgi:hypothetical protein